MCAAQPLRAVHVDFGTCNRARGDPWKPRGRAHETLAPQPACDLVFNKSVHRLDTTVSPWAMCCG